MIKKAFLYCTKLKPWLEFSPLNMYPDNYGAFDDMQGFLEDVLNGLIPCMCDIEVDWYDTSWCCNDFIEHNGLEKSCLKEKQLFDYVKGRNEFYAIQIKNLTIFDEPMKLSDLMQDVPRYETGGHVFANEDEKWINIGDGPFAILVKKIEKAPQNMMYCYYFDKETNMWEKAVLISIRPEWMAEIMNGYKTYEIRRKVLKEMIR